MTRPPSEFAMIPTQCLQPSAPKRKFAMWHVLAPNGRRSRCAARPSRCSRTRACSCSRAECSSATSRPCNSPTPGAGAEGALKGGGAGEASASSWPAALPKMSRSGRLLGVRRGGASAGSHCGGTKAGACPSITLRPCWLRNTELQNSAWCGAPSGLSQHGCCCCCCCCSAAAASAAAISFGLALSFERQQQISIGRNTSGSGAQPL